MLSNTADNRMILFAAFVSITWVSDGSQCFIFGMNLEDEGITFLRNLRNHPTTQRHIPEDLNSHRLGNFPINI